MRHQRAQQELAIDAVGLRPPRALLNRNAGRIEHMVDDPRRRQQPVQPEPVVARLVTAHYRRRRPQPPRRTFAHALDQRKQASMIPAQNVVAREPVPIRTVHRHQPAPPAQFDCNENRANIAPDGRANVGCLHLTPPMVRVWKPKPIGCTPIAP